MSTLNGLNYRAVDLVALHVLNTSVIWFHFTARIIIVAPFLSVSIIGGFNEHFVLSRKRCAFDSGISLGKKGGGTTSGFASGRIWLIDKSDGLSVQGELLSGAGMNTPIQLTITANEI